MFVPAILRKAQAIASGYRLVIAPEPDIGWMGSTVELPGVMADGDSVEACAREIMEATVAAVATLLEQGESPPKPASEARRDQQVNIRLTIDEKQSLSEAAKHAGFRSVSDYIRTRALDQAS